MSAMTQKMSEAGSGQPVAKGAGFTAPKKGDRYRCQKCGMELQIAADCRCSDPAHVYFHCCGQELQRL